MTWKTWAHSSTKSLWMTGEGVWGRQFLFLLLSTFHPFILIMLYRFAKLIDDQSLLEDLLNAHEYQVLVKNKNWGLRGAAATAHIFWWNHQLAFKGLWKMLMYYALFSPKISWCYQRLVRLFHFCFYKLRSWHPGVPSYRRLFIARRFSR